MGLEALYGETEMITVFDDFNSVVLAEGFGDAANWETNGWELTEDAGGGALAADSISMNDPNADTQTHAFSSCIRIVPGTTGDSGGNMQLDAVNGAVAAPTNNHDFQHIWIDETATTPAAEALDNTTLVFACRIGLRHDITNTGAGAWGPTNEGGKVYIGWAAAGDTSVLDHDTGLVTDGAGNLLGFHICELGEIHGVSKRITADNYTLNTNYVAMAPVAVMRTVSARWTASRIVLGSPSTSEWRRWGNRRNSRPSTSQRIGAQTFIQVWSISGPQRLWGKEGDDE